jgi:hypothetical protein
MRTLDEERRVRWEPSRGDVTSHARDAFFREHRLCCGVLQSALDASTNTMWLICRHCGVSTVLPDDVTIVSRSSPRLVAPSAQSAPAAR